MSISVLQREEDSARVERSLREAGIRCSLSGISKGNYSEELTPLLLDLFQATSDPMVRLEIGRKLQFSKSPAIEEAFLEAFIKDVPLDTPGHDSFRWGIGSLLEAVA
jgi:hypothetical protein